MHKTRKKALPCPQAEECAFASEGTDQNQGRELPALSGRIVLHGVLDLVVGEREIRALAQLVLVDVIGIHRSLTGK